MDQPRPDRPDVGELLDQLRPVLERILARRRIRQSWAGSAAVWVAPRAKEKWGW